MTTRTKRPAGGPAGALDAARRFLGRDAPLSVQPLGAGLINETFRVSGPAGDHVLQRVNTRVFVNPDGIMANLERLQALSDSGGSQGLRLPRLVRARDGRLLVRDGVGGCWRLMEHVPNSRILGRIDNDAQAREVGRMLGAFHRLAASADPATMAVTLRGFHDTPAYLAGLDEVLQKAPGDDSDVAAAAAFIAARREATAVLDRAYRAGRVPLRVIHGDPKLDNLLFAADADHALCLIDLDTVQPGLVHHDIGDCLRSCCNRAGESAGGAVRFDLDTCAAILAGYAAASEGLLSADEIALLYPAIRLLPLELGIRFLTDHLQGDRWFRVREHGQNLAKARVQLALVADIEARQDAIEAIIGDCFAGVP